MSSKYISVSLKHGIYSAIYKMYNMNSDKKYIFKSKSNSNQITFIVTSPQHKCLGEWNSWERAPDSAKKQQQQFT